MPQLDETGWTTWWHRDAGGETIEWRYGKALRVSTSRLGVHVSGEAIFTDDESRKTFTVVMGLAMQGVGIMRRRHERESRGHRVSVAPLAGDEEPDSRSVDLFAWTPPKNQVH